MTSSKFTADESAKQCDNCGAYPEPIMSGVGTGCSECLPPDPQTPKDSRIDRGIRLAAERADEFARVGPWTWIAPGNDRETYTVDLRHSYCTCPCFQSRRNKLNRKPEPCKHVYSAEIVSAKTKARKRQRVA